MDDFGLSCLPCTYARPDTLAYWPQTLSFGGEIWAQSRELQRAEERGANGKEAVAMPAGDRDGNVKLDGDSMDIDSVQGVSMKEVVRKRNQPHMDPWSEHNNKRQRIDCK